MNIEADPDLLSLPEAVWAQITLLVPVQQPVPASGLPGSPPWQESVALFPLSNQPGVHTDRQWRSAHIAPGVRPSLYGRRYAAVLPEPVELGHLCRSDGELVRLTTEHLEFLPTGIMTGFGPGGILIIHSELHGSLSPRSAENRLPIRWLSSQLKDLARSPAGGIPGISQRVSNWGLALDAASEILVATNLAVPGLTLNALRHDPAEDGTWSALNTWAWSLARATVPTRDMLRNPVRPATPGCAVALPRRLAVVDRAGVAIVTTDAVDHDPNVMRTLLDFIPIFQSIYTDVLALGFLQLLVTAEVGARLDALDDPLGHPREFHNIESRMRLLRNRFWRARITEWPWLDSILHSVQEENDLRAVLDQLTDNIHEFGGQLERQYQHGLNLILLLLGVLGLLGLAAAIFGAVAGFMTVLGTGRWGAIVGIIATSAALVALFVGGAIYMRRSVWRELAPYMRRRG